MHPFVRTILFRMTRDDSFDANSHADPPQRQPREPRQSWRSERTAIVRKNRARKPILGENTLERTTRVLVPGRLEAFTHHEISAHVINDRKRIAIAVITQQELP